MKYSLSYQDIVEIMGERGLKIRWNRGLFDTFTCTPNLPEEWPIMSLKAIKAFGKEFDTSIERCHRNIKINITVEGNVSSYICMAGEKITIKL
ncbi:hypothetical protein G9U52_23085 [Paenibacillus sp. S3N08]|uniref:Uncharacterized protein n=1 Tax=Paenibacillus agricola TaxID=2716264 RepID=A0ABX0JFT1_9BACL|nr:hypothetical protein [Paenibacillus agricola]